MKTKRYIIILLCFLVASACRKKKYPTGETIGEPEFYIKATINGQEFNQSAGINDYRMYTSYTQNSQGLYSLQGHLKTGGCSASCPASLKISINNFTTLATGAAINITEALAAGDREFLTAPQSVEFTPNFNKPAASYQWDFGDGQSSALEKPKHSFEKPGTYVVKLTAISTTGCNSTIYNTVRVGRSGIMESANILQTSAQGRTLSFKCQVNGGTPQSYYWSFGDGSHSTLSQPTHSYLVTGSYPVSVKIVDTRLDTITAYFNAVTQNDAYSCAINYSASAASSEQESPLQSSLSKVFFEWTDGAGNTFSSSKALQPKNSFFTITSIGDYENNENGQKTKKVRLRFQCYLKDNNNNLVKIENAEAVISVAYN